MHFPTDRTVHTIAFDGQVVDRGLERKIAQTANAPGIQVRSDDPNLYMRVLYHLSYVPLAFLLMYSKLFIHLDLSVD